MLNSFVKKSQLLFLFSFCILIAAGTLLLKLPGIFPRDLSWIDALYTATSAVCVTGLSVTPICDFSFAGQFIILLLIQLGGIGIVTLSASFVLFLGKHFSFNERLMMSTLNDDFSLRNAELLIKLVVRYTLICELAGAVIILIGNLIHGEEFFPALWHAVFVSIASFCNAGLSPYPDSVMSLSRLSQFGSALMILTGSLGIYVIYDIMQRLSGKRPFMKAHSKLVIWATALLLITSTFLLRYLGTTDGALLSWLDSGYMAVSSCSAGFNSVPVDHLNDISLVLCMFLMLVGGAPGSTAGGLKISTVAIAAAAIWNTITGNRQTIVFRRHIPHDNVMKAFAVITLFAILVVAGSIAVKMTNPNQDLGCLLFESVSAICTVGLSIGETSSKMPDAGKVVTILLMYIGRIGPLTLLIFLLAREKPGKVQYPEERIIIG